MKCFTPPLRRLFKGDVYICESWTRQMIVFTTEELTELTSVDFDFIRAAALI